MKTSKNPKILKSLTKKRQIQDCCKHSKIKKKCIRKSDMKIFLDYHAGFSRKKCKNVKGFTMRSSCAPYKDCIKIVMIFDHIL